MNLNTLTLHSLIELIDKKTITTLDIVYSLFDRIDSVQEKTKSFIWLDKEEILNKYKNMEFKGILRGIPIAIKDNLCVKDEPTTCCSKILENFNPFYNATVIDKIQDNSGICFGKTNMDEFAFGSSCETSFYGACRNPWDLSRIPGGSSGGSASCVASDEAICALGSDTGGSIRQPASLCGVVGLKPTYGRVSRFGLIAFASSLDQIGPIAKDVKDAALLLRVISGYDEKDSTSCNVEVEEYDKLIEKDIKGLRCGLPREYFTQGIDPDVKNAVMDAVKVFTKLGVEYEDINLPHTEFAVGTYYIIATAEASSNLARFDGVQYGFRNTETRNQEPETRGSLLNMYETTRAEGFGPEAKRRIILGTYVLSRGYYEAYYLRALKVRTLIKRDFDEAFNKVDFILSPTSPTPAFKLGEKIEDPLSMYLSDIYTISANLAGVPAISIPCGISKDGLPIGLQVLAKPFNENALLRAAYAFEQVTDWHKRKPPLE